jgi:hypothetical protein
MRAVTLLRWLIECCPSPGNFIALAVGGLLVFAYLRYSANSRQAVAGKKTQ